MNNIPNLIANIKGIPTKEELIELLINHPIIVTFNKLDGDERVMTCTLQASSLPPATDQDKLSQTKIRNLEDKLVVVWDLKAQAWRSFRYDRVTKIEVATA